MTGQIRDADFLNDLDVGGCIFKENVRHSTYHLRVYQQYEYKIYLHKGKKK